MRHTGQGC